MKIHYTIKMLAYVLALPMIFTACSDDEYTPAQPVADDCPGVYFSNDNANSYIFTTDELGDEWSFDLTVNRTKSAGALDVPLKVVSADECFSFPASVHFEDGETETSLNVKFPNIPKFENKKFLVKVPDEYIDLYSKEINGAGAYSCSVLVSEWRKIVRDAEGWGTQFYYFFDVYWLAGINRFRFTNFLESGITLTFEILNPAFDASKPDTWNGYISPLDNFEKRDTTDKGYLRWYLYDDAKGQRPVWKTEYYGKSQKNIFFVTNELDINFLRDIDYEDERVSLYKRNSTSAYVSFYWNEVNIEGYTDEDSETD